MTMRRFGGTVLSVALCLSMLFLSACAEAADMQTQGELQAEAEGSAEETGAGEQTETAEKMAQEAGEETTDGTSSTGIQNIQAQALVYSSLSPMLDSFVITYGDEIVLLEKEVQKLYTFADGGESRAVVDVSISRTDPIGGRGQADSGEDTADAEAAGRYVVVRLAPQENPDPESGDAWRADSAAGRTVLWSGSHSERRLDYSELTLTQNFDAVNPEGRMIQPAGELPAIGWEDISWPQLRGFVVDSVLEGENGEIHYSYRLPENYDSAGSYPMVVTLPGYNGLLLSDNISDRGVNIYADYTVVPWAQASDELIILSPQLTGWGEESARQTIELTEYFLENYAVDRSRVYGAGYSAGGETMSRVMGMRADLFAAYLHGSSQWDGNFDTAAENGTAVYILMAQSDDYYGRDRAVAAYEGLRDSYEAQGMGETEIDNLLRLDLRPDEYFNAYGLYSYHAAGMAALNDPQIIRWILSQRKNG